LASTKPSNRYPYVTLDGSPKAAFHQAKKDVQRYETAVVFDTFRRLSKSYYLAISSANKPRTISLYNLPHSASTTCRELALNRWESQHWPLGRDESNERRQNGWPDARNKITRNFFTPYPSWAAMFPAW
jgi:hypothetical protein